MRTRSRRQLVILRIGLAGEPDLVVEGRRVPVLVQNTGTTAVLIGGTEGGCKYPLAAGGLLLYSRRSLLPNLWARAESDHAELTIHLPPGAASPFWKGR